MARWWWYGGGKEKRPKVPRNRFLLIETPLYLLRFGFENDGGIFANLTLKQ